MKNALTGLLLLSMVFLATGFDLRRHSIPLDEIRAGGPPKDGIPALTEAVFVKASKASFMKKAPQGQA